MREVALARLWRLDDGTTCLLLKDPRVGNWEIRVVRDAATIRSEHFGSPITAMEEAKNWRRAFSEATEKV